MDWREYGNDDEIRGLQVRGLPYLANLRRGQIRLRHLIRATNPLLQLFHFGLIDIEPTQVRLACQTPPRFDAPALFPNNSPYSYLVHKDSPLQDSVKKL